MSKRILITGGAGFIAHHVIDKILSTTDWESITLDRLDFSGNLNVGSGKDISIRELANKISSLTKYNGKIIWDKNQPDGTPRKLLNIQKIKDLGWEPKISLKEGIKKTIESFKKEYYR